MEKRKKIYNTHTIYIKKIEKAFEKCEDSINCMNQIGGSKIVNNKILTIINFEIKQLKKKKKQIKLKLDEYNKLLFI